MSDTLFTWADLQAKLNSELLNNLGNFINRVLSFIAKPSGQFELLLIFSFYSLYVYFCSNAGGERKHLNCAYLRIGSVNLQIKDMIPPYLILHLENQIP